MADDITNDAELRALRAEAALEEMTAVKEPPLGRVPRRTAQDRELSTTGRRSAICVARSRGGSRRRYARPSGSSTSLPRCTRGCAGSSRITPERTYERRRNGRDPRAQRGDYLDEVLSAIRAQVVDHDVEILIVDSGSSDGSLRSPGTHGTRVQKIPASESRNGGPANPLMELANGSHVAFLTQDATPA